MRAAAAALPDFCALCDMLSDPTRLRLMLVLAKGPRHVTSLCDELQLRQPTVSHHLALLRMTGLIVGQRQGKQVIYALASHAKGSGGKLKVALPPYRLTVEA